MNDRKLREEDLPDNADMVFFDIDGNVESYSIIPSWEGLSEDEIFNQPAWKDKAKAKEIFQKLKKSFSGGT